MSRLRKKDRLHVNSLWKTFAPATWDSDVSFKESDLKSLMKTYTQKELAQMAFQLGIESKLSKLALAKCISVEKNIFFPEEGGRYRHELLMYMIRAFDLSPELTDIDLRHKTSVDLQAILVDGWRGGTESGVQARLNQITALRDVVVGVENKFCSADLKQMFRERRGSNMSLYDYIDQSLTDAIELYRKWMESVKVQDRRKLLVKLKFAVRHAELAVTEYLRLIRKHCNCINDSGCKESDMPDEMKQWLKRGEFSDATVLCNVTLKGRLLDFKPGEVLVPGYTIRIVIKVDPNKSDSTLDNQTDNKLHQPTIWIGVSPSSSRFAAPFFKSDSVVPNVQKELEKTARVLSATGRPINWIMFGLAGLAGLGLYSGIGQGQGTGQEQPTGEATGAGTGTAQQTGTNLVPLRPGRRGTGDDSRGDESQPLYVDNVYNPATNDFMSKQATIVGSLNRIPYAPPDIVEEDKENSNIGRSAESRALEDQPVGQVGEQTIPINVRGIDHPVARPQYDYQRSIAPPPKKTVPSESAGSDHDMSAESTEPGVPGPPVGPEVLQGLDRLNLIPGNPGAANPIHIDGAVDINNAPNAPDDSREIIGTFTLDEAGNAVVRNGTSSPEAFGPDDPTNGILSVMSLFTDPVNGDVHQGYPIIIDDFDSIGRALSDSKHSNKTAFDAWPVPAKDRQTLSDNLKPIVSKLSRSVATNPLQDWITRNQPSLNQIREWSRRNQPFATSFAGRFDQSIPDLIQRDRRINASTDFLTAYLLKRGDPIVLKILSKLSKSKRTNATLLGVESSRAVKAANEVIERAAIEDAQKRVMSQTFTQDFVDSLNASTTLNEQYEWAMNRLITSISDSVESWKEKYGRQLISKQQSESSSTSVNSAIRRNIIQEKSINPTSSTSSELIQTLAQNGVSFNSQFTAIQIGSYPISISHPFTNRFYKRDLSFPYGHTVGAPMQFGIPMGYGQPVDVNPFDTNMFGPSKVPVISQYTPKPTSLSPRDLWMYKVIRETQTQTLMHRRSHLTPIHAVRKQVTTEIIKQIACSFVDPTECFLLTGGSIPGFVTIQCASLPYHHMRFAGRSIIVENASLVGGVPASTGTVDGPQGGIKVTDGRTTKHLTELHTSGLATWNSLSNAQRQAVISYSVDITVAMIDGHSTRNTKDTDLAQIYKAVSQFCHGITIPSGDCIAFLMNAHAKHTKTHTFSQDDMVALVLQTYSEQVSSIVNEVIAMPVVVYLDELQWAQWDEKLKFVGSQLLSNAIDIRPNREKQEQVFAKLTGNSRDHSNPLPETVPESLERLGYSCDPLPSAVASAESHPFTLAINQTIPIKPDFNPDFIGPSIGDPERVKALLQFETAVAPDLDQLIRDLAQVIDYKSNPALFLMTEYAIHALFATNVRTIHGSGPMARYFPNEGLDTKGQRIINVSALADGLEAIRNIYTRRNNTEIYQQLYNHLLPDTRSADPRLLIKVADLFDIHGFKNWSWFLRKPINPTVIDRDAEESTLLTDLTQFVTVVQPAITESFVTNPTHTSITGLVSAHNTKIHMALAGDNLKEKGNNWCSPVTPVWMHDHAMLIPVCDQGTLIGSYQSILMKPINETTFQQQFSVLGQRYPVLSWAHATDWLVRTIAPTFYPSLGPLINKISTNKYLNTVVTVATVGYNVKCGLQLIGWSKVIVIQIVDTVFRRINPFAGLLFEAPLSDALSVLNLPTEVATLFAQIPTSGAASFVHVLYRLGFSHESVTTLMTNLPTNMDIAINTFMNALPSISADDIIQITNAIHIDVGHAHTMNAFKQYLSIFIASVQMQAPTGPYAAAVQEVIQQAAQITGQLIGP